MTTLSKEEIVRVLRRAGLADTAARLAPLLPERMDLDRESALLDRFGVNRDDLISRMGGSP